MARKQEVSLFLTAMCAALLIAGCASTAGPTATPGPTQMISTPRCTPELGADLQTPIPGYVKIRIAAAKDSLSQTGIFIKDANGERVFDGWLDIAETIALYLPPGAYTYDTQGVYTDQMPLCYEVTATMNPVVGARIDAVRDEIDIEIRGGNRIDPIPGCNPNGTTTELASTPESTATLPLAEYNRPEDFRVEYYWNNGTVAPPYHYGYDIIIESAGQSKVVLTCGYPGLLDYPGGTYTETIDIQQMDLDELYLQFVKNGLYMQNWRELTPAPGGGSESVVVTVQGRQLHTSSNAMFSAIRALVPEAIWTKLNDQREEFQRAHINWAAESTNVHASLTPSLRPTASLGTTLRTTVRAMDGMTMVYAPAGTFKMGSDTGGYWENPVHDVTLDAFWIDRTEVTNAQYAKCVVAGKCAAPSAAWSDSRDSYYGNVEYAQYPVIFVSWNDANAYCIWAGAQLPTEAQWEYAARGSHNNIYPWGNSPPNSTLLNYNNYENDTTAVGAYPSGASWVGAYDLAGNVWEWVHDWFGPYPISAQTNPAGPPSADNPSYEKVLRGGSWVTDEDNVRAASRGSDGMYNSSKNAGFRCAAAGPGK